MITKMPTNRNRRSTNRRYLNLPLDFYETEEWQNWFTDGLNHNIFIKLDVNTWLVVEIRSQESPGLLVFAMEASEESILDSIHERCDGMIKRSCNIKGLNTSGDKVPVVVNPNSTAYQSQRPKVDKTILPDLDSF